MAVVYLVKLEDFLRIMKRVGVGRYDLVYVTEEDAYYLIPIVTSRHVHTYVFRITAIEEKEIRRIKTEIEQTWSRLGGRVIIAEVIKLDKW